MARWIFIDNASGYIRGDSADLNGAIFTDSAVEYAIALDESLGVHDRQYEIVSSLSFCNEPGYRVYRADIDGSEAVTTVWDGQSQETIDSVVRDCRPYCCISITPAD